MPTYDYRCRDCGHTIEIVHSILEDGPETCDRCRGPLDRVLHPAGVIFKGSGFYSTDSRRTSGSADGATASSTTGDGSQGPAKSGSSATEKGAGGSGESSAKGETATTSAD